MGRKRIILVSTILVLVGAGFAAIFFLEPLLEAGLDRYLREKISVSKQSPTYAFTYDDLEFDMTAARVTFRDFRMDPQAPYIEAFRAGRTQEKALKEVRVSKVTVEGIGLLNFLWDKKVKIREIAIDSVTLNLLQADSVRFARQNKTRGGDFSLDSIRLPGIQELSLGQITVNHMGVYSMRQQNEDTVSTFASRGVQITGLALEKLPGAEGSFFRLDPEALYIRLDPERLDLRQSLYTMGFRNMEYTYAERNLHVRDLLFRPREARDSFRLKNRYSYEVYEATSTDLILEGFDLNAFIHSGEFVTDRMLIDSLRLEIFRDKTLPYNTGKEVALPNRALAQTRFPLYIGMVGLRDSELKYVELTEAGKPPLVVNFLDVDGTVTHVSSMPYRLKEGDSLGMDLDADLNGEIPVKLSVRMPYGSDRFRVVANTEGTSRFSSLNETVLPALGMRFASGRLDGLRFEATGTPRSIWGNLTLRYQGLKVEIIQEHHRKRGLSWVANALLKNSNPDRLGHTVIGHVEFTRIPYKGMANFVWKGVQSGVINSLNPFGKHRVVGL